MHTQTSRMPGAVILRLGYLPTHASPQWWATGPYTLLPTLSQDVDIPCLPTDAKCTEIL